MGSEPGTLVLALLAAAKGRAFECSPRRYTSGSTGKPKGIVHVHGGYQVGLCRSAELVLGLTCARPERDRPADARQGGGSEMLLVVATPGWITGQSYMLSAAVRTSNPTRHLCKPT